MKRNDQVMTPDGPGRIITLPTAKSSPTYVVLRPDGRAATYDAKQLAPVEVDPCPPPTPTTLPNSGTM